MKILQLLPSALALFVGWQRAFPQTHCQRSCVMPCSGGCAGGKGAGVDGGRWVIIFPFFFPPLLLIALWHEFEFEWLSEQLRNRSAVKAEILGISVLISDGTCSPSRPRCCLRVKKELFIYDLCLAWLAASESVIKKKNPKKLSGLEKKKTSSIPR